MKHLTVGKRHCVMMVQRGCECSCTGLGHIPTTLSKEESHLQNFSDKHGLCYVPAANPADVNLDQVGPGQKTAILRGLGSNFFDYMVLLTVGRGGYFIRKQGRLLYEASGREPKLYASARGGIPYHARGENQREAFGRHEPLFVTREAIDEFRNRANQGERVIFRQEAWPLIVQWPVCRRQRWPCHCSFGIGVRAGEDPKRRITVSNRSPGNGIPRDPECEASRRQTSGRTSRKCIRCDQRQHCKLMGHKTFEHKKCYKAGCVMVLLVSRLGS